jgi:hypothetical protein
LETKSLPRLRAETFTFRNALMKALWRASTLSRQGGIARNDEKAIKTQSLAERRGQGFNDSKVQAVDFILLMFRSKISQTVLPFGPGHSILCF